MANAPPLYPGFAPIQQGRPAVMGRQWMVSTTHYLSTVAGNRLLAAGLLITGLSISTLIISIFGPTRELIASFAWVLAASFVVNGLMLLEVASCERGTAA